jgi:spermidine synthase
MARWTRPADEPVAAAETPDASPDAAAAATAETATAAATTAAATTDEATTAEATAAAAPGPDAAAAIRRRRGFESLVPVLFMASGAAGLIYQVVWTQDLVLIFGDTTLAIVTTVSAFLAGLGTGALIGAALATRLRRALRAYGLVETAVGILALIMPLLFDVVATLFRSAYLSLSPVEVELIRFGLAFVALMPVTVLMGMSLPLLTRHLVRTDPDIGQRIARLYGLNTLGAVIGSVASGYFLIELIGLRETTFVAVALNLIAGLGAIAISRRLAADPAQAQEASAVPATPRPPLRRRQWLMLGVTFMSGLVSLALEVLWTRIMLQGTGSSIYVFIAVVSVFLIGIATGSLVYERRKDRVPQPATLGFLLALAAALALVPLVISNVYGPGGLPLVVLLILPVTAILGYTFPLTVRLFVVSAAQAGRGVGLVYAVNTAGCVVGTVSAGFLLIPNIGPSGGIIAVCLLQAVVGMGLGIAYARRWALIQPVIACIAAVAIAAMIGVPAARLTYIQRTIPPGTPTAHFDDPVASVDVESGSTAKAKNLLINGFGITKLTIDTKLLAYIPKAAMPSATTMLNICFGMGSTFRSSIIAGLHTTAVELDPTVPTVMHWFYADASHYLHSPLAHVVISDGRNYVRLSNKRYDLITIDAPPPLWSAGAVVLITREFYQEARQRLAPGGILTSFLPYDNPRLLIRTAKSAFRYVVVLKGLLPFGMYIMASQRPIKITRSAILHVFGTPAIRADLDSAPDYKPTATRYWPGIIDRSVWLRNNAAVRRFTGSGPLLTDDRPSTEYFLLASFDSFSRSGPIYEKAAVETGGVVVALLILLAIGLAAFGGTRRLRRRRDLAPGQGIET